MKRVIIYNGWMGLIFKRGNYKSLIAEGSHWIMPNHNVIKFDMAKQFQPEMELNIFLKDKQLLNHLHIVEVGDDEIVLLYENGNFKRVLSSGRYAFWKGLMEYQFVKAELSKVEITEKIETHVLLHPAVLPYVRVISIEPYHKGLLYIDGNFMKVLETGEFYFWKNATKIYVAKADLRRMQIEISGQELLTKDKVALRLSCFAQYQVVDVMKALHENKDYEKQLYVLIQLALREIIGSYALDEILENKNVISTYVKDTMNSKAMELGVVIKDCGIRDIILPGEVKDIMNQVLVAHKRAQANVITRREETASTRSLLNTAKLMEENAMLFKLKEMEYVEKIADKIHTISLSGGSQIAAQLKAIFSPSME